MLLPKTELGDNCEFPGKNATPVGGFGEAEANNCWDSRREPPWNWPLMNWVLDKDCAIALPANCTGTPATGAGCSCCCAPARFNRTLLGIWPFARSGFGGRPAGAWKKGWCQANQGIIGGRAYIYRWCWHRSSLRSRAVVNKFVNVVMFVIPMRLTRAQCHFVHLEHGHLHMKSVRRWSSDWWTPDDKSAARFDGMVYQLKAIQQSRS